MWSLAMLLAAIAVLDPRTMNLNLPPPRLPPSPPPNFLAPLPPPPQWRSSLPSWMLPDPTPKKPLHGAHGAPIHFGRFGHGAHCAGGHR